MKKFLKSLFSLLVVLGLVSVAVACNKTEEKTPVEETKGEVTPTPTPTPTPKPTPTPAPQPTEKEPTSTYHVVGGYYGDWNDYTDVNKMKEISVDELDEEIASQLLDKEITAVVKLENRLFDKKGEWTANAYVGGSEAVQFDGGFTIKVVKAGFDKEDNVSFAEQWNPDPKTSCVQNLTPETLYMPKWVETPAAGEEHLGKWDENPVVIGGVGEYDVYFVEYAGVNSLESPKYAMAVVPVKSNISYHVVGGYFDDWNNYTDSNVMTRVSALDLPAEVKAQLLDKEIVGIYAFDGRTFNVGPTWTANANIDGEVVTLNGGYTLKVVKAAYDEEDDVTFAQQWNPDPKTSAVQNLTPDTLYMPKWVETPAAGEEGLGTWADNPVVIGGAGEYTVYFVEYKGANSFESPKYAMGLIQTEKLEEPKTTAELIEEEYAGLVAGTVTEKTEFENIKAVVRAMVATKNADELYEVKLVVKLDDLYFALTFLTDDVTGLEVDKEVTFKGTIDHEAEAVSAGDFDEIELVFANPTVSWPKVGAPSELYVKGTMNSWNAQEAYVLKYNEAGNPEITLELAADAEFKVADDAWSNDKTYGYYDGLSAAFADNGGNIKVATAGIYTLTIVDGKLVIAAGRSGVYLKGSLNDWSDKAEYELRYNDQGLREITVELAANAEFKVATPDWKTIDLGSAAVETELTSAFDLTAGNIKVVTAGTYVVTLVETTQGEAKTYSLVITAAE